MLSILANAVFVAMWVLVAIGAFGDPQVLQDAWAWLQGLEPIAAIIVWIAILPVGVFLWAWQADLEPLLMSLVLVGLVAWTGVALSGIVRLIGRRLADGT